MTGAGLEPTPSKRKMPLTSALDHSVILPVCCVVNSMDDNRRYLLQVFNINDIILCIAMPTKCQVWDSYQGNRSDWCLKPAPKTTRPSYLYVLW